MQKRDELGDEVSVDNWLNGRVLFFGKKSSEAHSGEDHPQVVGVVDEHQHLLEVLQLKRGYNKNGRAFL